MDFRGGAPQPTGDLKKTTKTNYCHSGSENILNQNLVYLSHSTSVSLWASSLSLPSLLYGQMSQMKRRVAVFYHFVCVTTGFFWYSPFLLLFLVNKRQRSSLNEIKTIDNCLLFARQTVILTLPPKNSSFTSSTICHYFITHTHTHTKKICYDLLRFTKKQTDENGKRKRDNYL